MSFLQLIILSFVVENYVTYPLTYSNTISHNLSNRLLNSFLLKLSLNLLSHNTLNIHKYDNFWKYFWLYDTLSNSTNVLNLGLSYYFHEIQLLTYNLNTSNFLTNNNLLHTSSVSLVGLPIYNSSINNTLTFNLLFILTSYLPYFTSYTLSNPYFTPTLFFALYNNLNFYYINVYEH